MTDAKQPKMNRLTNKYINNEKNRFICSTENRLSSKNFRGLTHPFFIRLNKNK